MKIQIAAGVAILGLLMDATNVAAGPRGPQARMDREVVAAHDADQPARVLIKYRPGASPRLRQRLRQRGITPTRDVRGAGALSVTLGRGELRRWAQDPDIESISTDARIASHGEQDETVWSQLTSGFNLPPADVQYLRRTLGLQATAHGGRGVGVAVIDSGIAPMPDVAGQIAAFYDFTAGGVPAFPSDAYGHGTHVAGLIAGSGALSLGGYPGIAPEVRLIGLKVLDANGAGFASDALNAIEFAIENRVALGIDIINLSLGHPVLEPAASDPLVQAVERASAAGIVVVASAGNFGRRPDSSETGYGGISSPGNAPSALTVGALRTNDTAARGDDRVAPYSSRGPTWYDGQIKPDILAPGHGLVAAANPLSTLYRKPNSRVPAAGYLALNGTSMAAAVVTGVVALMVESSRDEHAAPLTPNTVKMLLQYTALNVTTTTAAAAPKQFEQGTGGLNAAAAIELARAINPGAAVGSYWLEHGASPVTSIDGVSEPWARKVIWGDRMVWGDAIARREAAWTSAVVWGTATTWSLDLTSDATDLVVDSIAAWGSDLVWAGGLVGTSADDEHIVWGDSTNDDEHIVWGNSADAEHIVWGSSAEADSPKRRKQ